MLIFKVYCTNIMLLLILKVYYAAITVCWDTTHACNLSEVATLRCPERCCGQPNHDGRRQHGSPYRVPIGCHPDDVEDEAQRYRPLMS